MLHGYSLPRFGLNALRALVELAAARIALHTIRPQDVLGRNGRIAAKAAIAARSRCAAEIAQVCDQTAFFINRMAARVPWRSDCLVQALAGQRWLADEGIASEIVVGTAKRADGAFESHAWLRYHDRIILGGDVTQYQPLLTGHDERQPK